MAFAAPGFLAMPSTAEAVALPCARPQKAEAIAIANPEVITTHAWSDMPPPPPPWANAGVAAATMIAVHNTRFSFFIDAPCCLYEIASVGGCSKPLTWSLTLRRVEQA